MTRRRLKAAERRVVDPAVAAIMDELRPTIAEMEKLVVDRLVELPEDLRYEALRDLMNEWGRELFTGAELGRLQLMDEA
jgi:hypothetical protein